MAGEWLVRGSAPRMGNKVLQIREGVSVSQLKFRILMGLALGCVVMFAVGCPLLGRAPQADFGAIPTSGLLPLLVQFTNLSSAGSAPITEWAWNFGDGKSSTERNPAHTYTNAGTYTVSLTVTARSGQDTETKSDLIKVTTAPPAANFTATPASGLVPLDVQFTDTSSPGTAPITVWSWNFGDGQTSAVRNPLHRYPNPGTYTVVLTVTTVHGADTETKTNLISANSAPPEAAFSATPMSGVIPLEVQFTDTSAAGTAPITSRTWNFGDSSASTEQNPAHTYPAAGVYTVSLRVVTNHGEDTETKQNYITATATPPAASFTAAPMIGLTPLDVQFTDTSTPGTAAITTWAWTFGDDETSDEPSPKHTYARGGTYTVTLTVTSAHGTNQATQENLITAVRSPIEVVDVPAGWFQMGARADDEAGSAAMLPRHYVQLDAYQIGKFEVTNRQFAEVLNWAFDQGYLVPDNGNISTNAADSKLVLGLGSQQCQIEFRSGQFVPKTRDTLSMAEHPVVEVTWHGAVAFCNWLSEMIGLTPCYDLETWERIAPTPNGFRLPTEAEWERAAGWDTTLTDVLLPDFGTGGQWLYGGSADFVDGTRANYDSLNPLELATFPYTTPVGYYNSLTAGTVNSVSPAGAYDMSGNAWEWCEDVYGAYSAEDQTNPVGQGSIDDWRVWRGGCWSTTQGEVRNCRSAYRISNEPRTHLSFLGFRVGRSLP